jgi:DNA-binding PadR family transcriptional regulator
MIHDSSQIKREKRLRRAILQLLNHARPNEFSGRAILDLLENTTDFTDSVGEYDDRPGMILRLCGDLADMGLIAQRDSREMKFERRGIDKMYYRITASGTALLAGQIPVSPLVDDERIS